MPSENVKRSAVYVALCTGRRAKEIAKFLDMPDTLVYRVKRNFDSCTGTEEEREAACINRKAHEVLRTVRTNEFVEDIKETIANRRSVSIRALAREKGVSYNTAWVTVRHDLGLKSYALRKAQLITPKQQENRLAKATALLNNLKHETAGMLRFFSDEKNFTQQQKINKRNQRYLTDDPMEVPVVMTVKFPVNVMVLGVISSDGDVMPPHIFEKGLRVNTDVYLDVMENVVKPWMDRVAAGRPYVFQQDSAPAHASKKTQAWLLENVPAHWSPDLWPPKQPRS